MPADRNFLAKLLSGQGGKPLSFEELLMQEKGDRDQAALRFNAQNGGPASTAMAGAPPPDLMPTGAIPTPTPSPGTPAPAGGPPTPTPRPDIPTPENGPIPPPNPGRPILEDRATRFNEWPSYPYGGATEVEQGQVSPTGGIHPTPLPGPLPTQVPVPAGTASPTPLPTAPLQGGVSETPAQVPTPTPLNRGNIVDYGSANRGAEGKLSTGKRRGRTYLRKPKK